MFQFVLDGHDAELKKAIVDGLIKCVNDKSEKTKMQESLRDQDLHSVSIWYILVLVLQMILTIVKVRTAFNLQ